MKIMEWLLQPNRLSTAFLSVIFLVTPGFSILFIYERDIFLNIDLVKLIILSVAIITPLILINFFAFISGKEVVDPKTIPDLTPAIFGSGLALYSSLIISVLSNFGITYFCYTAIAFEIITFIALWLISRKLH